MLYLSLIFIKMSVVPWNILKEFSVYLCDSVRDDIAASFQISGRTFHPAGDATWKWAVHLWIFANFLLESLTSEYKRKKAFPLLFACITGKVPAANVGSFSSGVGTGHVRGFLTTEIWMLLLFDYHSRSVSVYSLLLLLGHPSQAVSSLETLQRSFYGWGRRESAGKVDYHWLGQMG